MASGIFCPTRAMTIPTRCQCRFSLPHSRGLTGAAVKVQRAPRVSTKLDRFSVVTAAAATEDEVSEAPVETVNKDLEAKAILRFVRGSPHKMRRVLDQIRGCSYEEALIILEYMPFRACEPILKLVVSAAANAKHNLGLKKSKLYISECYADGGPVLKRVKFRAKGRADRIRKPTSHVTIKMKEKA